MTEQPENPPVFPQSCAPDGAFGGMEMRDYFAANFRFDGDGFSVAYAEALMGEPMPVQATVKERFDWWLTAEAKYRYAFADAMLRERGK